MRCIVQDEARRTRRGLVVVAYVSPRTRYYNRNCELDRRDIV